MHGRAPHSIRTMQRQILKTPMRRAFGRLHCSHKSLEQPYWDPLGKHPRSPQCHLRRCLHAYHACVYMCKVVPCSPITHSAVLACRTQRETRNDARFICVQFSRDNKATQMGPIVKATAMLCEHMVDLDCMNPYPQLQYSTGYLPGMLTKKIQDFFLGVLNYCAMGAHRSGRSSPAASPPHHQSHLLPE